MFHKMESTPQNFFNTICTLRLSTFGKVLNIEFVGRVFYFCHDLKTAKG